jgi:cation diffusion facilitator CzcD-associated flavoprotein CzcO
VASAEAGGRSGALRYAGPVAEGLTDTKAVIIGAGQAGLSVAFYLRRLGLDPGNDFVILDRGPGPGGAWQLRWDALKLGSAHRVNDLPGMDELGLSFDDADRQVPAKDVVADFYGRYEQHYGFQVVRPADVTRVTPTLDGFAVTFEGEHGAREVTTAVLVNATGTWGAPFVPWYPGMNDFAGRHLHTVDYRSADDLRDQDVVVVGGGTSAIGFLLELEGVAKSLTWCTRRPVNYLEGAQDLNIEAGARAVALQDEAARGGRALPSIVSTTGVPRSRRIQAAIERGLLSPREMFTSIEPDGVRFADGSFQHADAIIWATGFRPELRHLAKLKLREQAGGVTVGQSAATRNARVFFAGYGPTASTIGANRAGRTIARQVIATLSSLNR